MVDGQSIVRSWCTYNWSLLRQRPLAESVDGISFVDCCSTPFAWPLAPLFCFRPILRTLNWCSNLMTNFLICSIRASLIAASASDWRSNWSYRRRSQNAHCWSSTVMPTKMNPTALRCWHHQHLCSQSYLIQPTLMHPYDDSVSYYLNRDKNGKLKEKKLRLELILFARL